MRAICRYVSIEEIPDCQVNKSKYEKIVNPLSYDHGFKRGQEYLIVGITNSFDILHLYLVSDEDQDAQDLQIVPMVLFECYHNTVPSDWKTSFWSKDDEYFEILPERLSSTDNWFERYIDEDPEIMDLVKEEVNKLRFREKNLHTYRNSK